MSRVNQQKRGILFLSIAMLFMGVMGCKKEISADKKSSSAIQYKPYGLTEFYDACTDVEGNILILGNNSLTTKLVKANKDGVLIWQKDIPTFAMASPSGALISAKPDGSILLFGSHEINKAKFVFELEIIKLNSSGKTLKTTRFSIKDNSPGFPHPIYSTSPQQFLASDNRGGFYVQLWLSTSYTFSRGWENYTMHYSNNDSIDQNLEVSNVFGTDYYELATGINENVNYLGFRPSTAEFFVTQLDGADFLKGKLSKRFESKIAQLGNALTAVSDETHIYTTQIKQEQGSNFSEGISVTKIDLTNGAAVKDWLLPLKLDLFAGQFDFYMLNPAVDADAIYITVGISKDVYIIKSSKDGRFLWSFKIDGNLSREYPLKILPLKDGPMVLGYGSNNRSRENNLMMLKLNHNGELLEK